MKRKIEEGLKAWKAEPCRKPLIVMGCRRVGKTHSIREFLESSYKSHVEIDLEKDRDARMMLSGSLDPEAVIGDLIASAGREMVPGRSAIFLDGIQACPEALLFMSRAGNRGFDIIASCSFADGAP